ncbi:hypothetical protein PYCC9005_000307 [Savitreella phatthalungensis]
MAPPTKDPWARREAWRYQGPFSPRARFMSAFPGLGLGVGAFVVYLIAEKIFESKDGDKAHH